MKILHISTYGGDRGAARPARRLHLSLRRAGHDSALLALINPDGHPEIQTFQPPGDWYSRLRRRYRSFLIALEFARYQASRPSGSEYFSDDRSPYNDDLLGQAPTPEVINLHWVAGFIDYQSFLVAAAQRAPLIWRLSDLNPFTGGCHYDAGCGRYRQSCGSCPQLGSGRDDDLSRAIWRRKQATYARIEPRRLHLVPLNDWMAAKLEASPLLGRFPRTIIPNGVDLDKFSPRDPRLARDVLGLPQDAGVVLFVADSVENRRKGWAELTAALNGLTAKANLHLLSVGGGRALAPEGFPHQHVGRVDDERLLSLVYSAADLLVIPSLEDNLPNTVLEALACGTPVVGFKAGGIPEMVRPGVTGLLAPVGDVPALREAMQTLLDDPRKRREMAGNCRKIAVAEYSLEGMARNYLLLYERVLAEQA